MESVKNINSNCKAEIEGVYLFGGRDKDGPNNQLYILNTSSKKWKWEEPLVKGKPPLARYGHTMNYFPNKGILIIFGGRNDENSLIDRKSVV